MINFVDWIINTDWGTPLLILTISLLVGLVLLASLTMWLDSWRELIQSETDLKSNLSDTTGGKHTHWHWGWRTHHI